MAPDLIPPPSPAGRPPIEPDEDERANEGFQEASQLADEARAPRAAGPSPFRGRFGFVWGALVGVALCAVAAAVGLVAAPGDSGPPLAKNWSRWKPGTTRMAAGAQEIATHVGREYRLDNGDQLATISSSALELGGARLGVAVRPKGGELEILDGDGLLYVLNGLGANRSLPGTPSNARGRLVMREALELALYSFRYLDDVTMVGVLLPPPNASSTQARAIFYRPGDLLKELEVPLDRTLAPKTPQPKTMSKEEAARVESLALRNLFLASVQPLESDKNYLVLVEPETVK
jgi:hypothetical protein